MVIGVNSDERDVFFKPDRYQVEITSQTTSKTNGVFHCGTAGCLLNCHPAVLPDSGEGTVKFLQRAAAMRTVSG